MASGDVGTIKAIKSCKFKWEIDSFSSRCKKDGDVLKSPKFRTNISVISDIGCSLYCEKKDYKDCLSILLLANFEIKVVVSFKIFTNKGKLVVDQTLDAHGSRYTRWGRVKFIALDFVVNPANDVLNDDKLTIEFEITETDNETEEKGDVVDDYEALLSDDKFSDVSLVAEGKTLKAHKCILAKRSSVFATMFDTDMKEKQGQPVEIDDVKYDVLVELIRFIYSGRVNNIVAIVDQLAIAAEKYALDGLKKMCERIMRTNLSIDNVIGCLQLADRLRMDELKAEAIELVLENASDVSEKPEFDLLSDDIVRKVFRCLAKRYK
ncbi:speckle-type POZ protein [Nasonia vitripennis]|uniref:Uncharacterized protein n=1 Tax=Nasonia vitripennis TaxID=7425 RepID=A0A7M7M2T0_NASVI|nr:speckle-type POZ protein [Nasonia vitripennis]XP_008214854.1 speckle-type POZ protein [Nasonia vitripennis]XP_016845433.1 speckle-type POZ protein [Nasonia vitripennis]